MPDIELTALSNYSNGKFLTVTAGALDWATPVKTLDVDYGNSLSTAVSTTGSSKFELIVRADTTVSSNLNIPSRIRLRVENGAVITVNSGVTLTINSMLPSGNTQLFAGAGTATFGAGAVPFVNASWYSSFATAVSSLGTTNSFEFIAASNFTISSNLTVPKNLTYRPILGAILTVNTGVTLTIERMVDVGDVRVFSPQSSTAKARFAKNAVPHFNVFWWNGAPSGVDDSWAVGQAFDSAVFAGGGIVHFPMGVWRTNGGHLINSLVTVSGIVDSLIDGEGSQLKLISTSANAYLIKNNQQNFTNLWIKNITLDVTSNSTGVGVLIEGAASSGNGRLLKFDKVRFRGGLYGVKVNATDGLWEVQGVNWNHCFFEAQVSGGAGVWVNTPNSNFKLDTCVWYITEGAYGVYGHQTLPPIVIDNYMANGPSSSVCLPGDLPNPTGRGRALLYVGANHCNVTLSNGIDEGLQYLIIYNGWSQKPVTLTGNTIQAFIWLQHTGMFFSAGNNYASGAYVDYNAPDTTPGDARVFSVGDTVFNTNPCGTVYSNPRIDNFTNGSEVYFSSGLYGLTYRRASKFIDNSGNTSVPVVQVLTPNNNQKIMRMGVSSSESALYYFDWERDGSGWLRLTCSQSGVGFYSVQPFASLSGSFTDYVSVLNPSVGAVLLRLGQGSNVYDFSRDSNGYLNITGSQAGFIGMITNFDVHVPDSAYSSSWDGNTSVTTKNAVYDFSKANYNNQSGTTYTLQSSDMNKIVVCTNSSPITLTVPNSLGSGFKCSVRQGGSGQVTISAGSGVTITNADSHTKTAKQNATVNLDTSNGTSYILSGYTGA